MRVLNTIAFYLNTSLMFVNMLNGNTKGVLLNGVAIVFCIISAGLMKIKDEDASN